MCATKENLECNLKMKIKQKYISNDKIALTRLSSSLPRAEKSSGRKKCGQLFVRRLLCSILFMARAAGNRAQIGSSHSLRSGWKGYSVPWGIELEVKVENYAYKSVYDTFEMK